MNADIAQVAGHRLYTLSKNLGLRIIDLSEPTELKVLGGYGGMWTSSPFQMYLRGDIVLALVNTPTQLLQFDVSDPAAIMWGPRVDLAGEILDSKLIGDVLYVVSFERGAAVSTRLTSFAARSLEKIDELQFVSERPVTSPDTISIQGSRVYVARTVFDEEPIRSSIQVFDISSGTGAFKPGAVLSTRAQVAHASELDEYAGVLRIVGQVPVASERDHPLLQTFRVLSSDDVQPLAERSLDFGPNQRFDSARFDGPRAYLISEPRSAPLIPVDLTDPANPRQGAPIEMEGLHRIEPWGDRLITLGSEPGQTFGEGTVVVSLYDVTELSPATLVSRVTFGQPFTASPGGPDSRSDGVRWLPEKSLLLVPYAGRAHAASPIA